MAEVALKSLYDFEVAAKARCTDANIWDYISRGDEKTRSEKRAAFQKYWLQPNILTARQPVPSTWTTILGQPIRIPICLSPSTVQALVAPPDGDVLAAEVAKELDTLLVFSSVSRMKYDDIGPRLPPGGLFWAQTYLFRDKRNTLHIVRNAERYGFKALVVTADSPIDYASKTSSVDVAAQYKDRTPGSNVSPNIVYLDGKQRESRNYSAAELWSPGHGLAAKETFWQPTWEDIKWLKSQTKLPIVLKGVLTAKAARSAVRAGVDGILVSSHGGRQLPGVPPPLFALPDVLEAVKGTNIEVYLDGEVRSGSDVFKAIALGARAVFIGRPVLWGLAVNRKEGLEKVMKILEDELRTIVTMCGCKSIQEVDSSFVKLKSMF